MPHERARPDSLSNFTMTFSNDKHRFPLAAAAFLAVATAIVTAYGLVPYGKLLRVVHIGSGGFWVRVNCCVCCVLRCRPCCPVSWVEILSATASDDPTVVLR